MQEFFFFFCIGGLKGNTKEMMFSLFFFCIGGLKGNTKEMMFSLL